MTMHPPRRVRAIGIASGLAVLALLVPRGAAYGDTLFNMNPLTTNQSFPVDAADRAAQSFTPTTSFVLYNVTLRVRNVGGVADAFNVTIETDLGGSPSGAVLARGAASRG